MFRLAESLKKIEPENSSRLILGLRFAREELIVHQMHQAERLLGDLKLDDAIAEQKQLLVTLQRLHDLLLSEDLDFQMRLARLKQLRSILAKLDGVIQEENREKQIAAELAHADKQIEQLRKRQASLDELIRRQQKHVVTANKLLAAKENESPPTDALPPNKESSNKEPANKGAVTKNAARLLESLSSEQETTRTKTAFMAESQRLRGGKPKTLDQASAAMSQALESLGKKSLKPAADAQQNALDRLTQAKADNQLQLKKLEKQREQQRYAALKRDQAANRSRTDDITQSVQSLGSAGTRAVGELTRAGNSMSAAERALQLQKAQSAGQEQQNALQSLRVAREDLQHEHDSLLDSLRAEVRPRVLDALRTMLDQQTAVRIASEALAPKTKETSRRAFTAVVALSRSEEQIIKTIDEIISLVEETEFGIALPAVLKVVRRSMDKVRRSLAAGTCDEAVIRREREIEADLATLLDAMKRMPAPKSKSQQPRRKSDPRQQERELNRLLAEVKMIRLLQLRVNQETVEIDEKRSPDEELLSREVRETIRAVEQGQEAVREATEKLGKQRGA